MLDDDVLTKDVKLNRTEDLPRFYLDTCAWRKGKEITHDKQQQQRQGFVRAGEGGKP